METLWRGWWRRYRWWYSPQEHANQWDNKWVHKVGYGWIIQRIIEWNGGWIQTRSGTTNVFLRCGIDGHGSAIRIANGSNLTLKARKKVLQTVRDDDTRQLADQFGIIVQLSPKIVHSNLQIWEVAFNVSLVSELRKNNHLLYTKKPKVIPFMDPDRWQTGSNFYSDGLRPDQDLFLEDQRLSKSIMISITLDRSIGGLDFKNPCFFVMGSNFLNIMRPLVGCNWISINLSFWHQ